MLLGDLTSCCTSHQYMPNQFAVYSLQSPERYYYISKSNLYHDITSNKTNLILCNYYCSKHFISDHCYDQPEIN